MTTQTHITLNDGNTIPQVGLGVWKAEGDAAPKAVKAAIDAGYRHIDTAAAYGNEAGVGEGIRESGVARQDLFVTTKLWNDAQGYDSTLAAFDKSMSLLGLDTLDLYLVHWPAPKKGLYVDTWRALVKLKEDGRVRSIGVSNFEREHLDHIIAETGVKPVINQIELHPGFQQHAMRKYHQELGIATQAWSPLGQGSMLSTPAIEAIARKHGKSPAQVIIRWHIDNGLVVIPKSVTPSRIAENFDVFSFKLDDQDMAAIAKLDAADGRIGPDPMKADF
jgi:2,5-diketo-D-gluconate reductase A